MAMGPFTIFAKNLDKTDIATLITSTVKVALVSDSYVPDSDADGHSVWADISTYEITAANGYTAGGAELGTLAQAATADNDGFKFTSGNPTWTASGGNIDAWNMYVIYAVGTVWGLTNPVIGYGYGFAGGASDVPATSDGNTLTITMPATGWFDRTT